MLDAVEGLPRPSGRMAVRETAAAKICELLFALLDHDPGAQTQRRESKD